MGKMQSARAMVENPPCEIIQQQSQRYSHQSNGGAEPMVQTIRKQPKACKKIQIEKSSGITINVDSPLLAWVTTTRSMEIHVIPLTTRLNNHSPREDSNHVSPKPNLTRRRGSCLQTTRSTGQQVGISMARRRLART